MRLVCPHCDTGLKVSARPEDDAVIKCPRCKKPFTVGSPEDAEDDDDRDDDRPVRKKKSKKGEKKPPVAAIVGVSVAVVAVLAVVVVLAVGDRKPTVKQEEDTPVNVAAPPPPVASELKTRVTELFRAPVGNVAEGPLLPSLEVVGDQAIAVPTFSSLKAKASDPKAGAKAPDPGKVIEEVSKSTVFIKLQGAGVLSTGSGFVIRTQGTTALVATNHHVIEESLRQPGVKITTTFDSGTPATEQEAAATVIAHDKGADLAILRVPGVKRMPPIIDPGAAPTPTPTMEVLICGFPLVLPEVAAGKSPNISIGRGAVSSIKKTRTGEMDQVQIDGVLNPGNSGGPIVERATGRLVGIAVTTVRTGVGLGVGGAVPVTKLLGLLDGRPHDPIFSGAAPENGESAFKVEVPLADPLKQIKAVSLYVKPGPAAAGAKDAATGWKRMDGATQVDLRMEDGKATGQFKLPVAGDKSPVGVQVVCAAVDSTVAVSAPVTYTLTREGYRSAGETIPMNALNRNPEKYTGQSVVVRGKMMPATSPTWDVFELSVLNDNDVAPVNLMFLTGSEVANQLKELPDLPIVLTVQLTCHVGRAAGTGKTLVRVTRIDLMGKGNKVALTVPSDTLGKMDQLFAVNRNPENYVGQTLTLQVMLPGVGSHGGNPGFTENDLGFLLSSLRAPENLVFQTTRDIATQLSDEGPTHPAAATATVRVENRRLGNGKRVVTVLKVEVTVNGNKKTFE